MDDHIRTPYFARLRIQAMVFIVALGLTFVIDQINLLNKINYIFFDKLIKTHRSDIRLPEEIAIVLIDESSLKTMDPILGSFPWPRSVYADLLEYFELGGARAVVFDILLTERERNTTPGRALTDSDSRLVEATARSETAYHSAMFLTEDEAIAGDLKTDLPVDILKKHSIPSAQGFKPDRYNDFVLPFNELSQATPHLGIVSLDPDTDGVYRRARLFWEYQDHVFPALSVSPLIDYLDTNAVSLASNTVKIADRRLPVDENENFLINYYGELAPYSMAAVLVSIIKINKGEIEDLPIYPDEFADKVVFIGASAIGLDDIKATPIDPKAPGVFIHAAAAGNIISDDILRPASTMQNYGIAIVLAIVIISTIFRLPNFWAQLGVPFLLTGIFWIWSNLMFSANLVYNGTVPMTALSFAWLGSFTYISFTEGADKRRVKKMLSQYVSEAVMNEALASPNAVLHARVGRKEVMSVLFSDIRNFTRISESEPAEKVVQLLNCHFTHMTDAIFLHQGTLDKFIGDALMAFWGAPVYVEHHADLAVQAAMTMVERLPEVNLQLKELNLEPIDIGIGINTGEVILGNIGSDRKLDYTVIGDSVNLSARLESITKIYKCRIIISENTYRKLTDKIPCLLVDQVRVKGKKKPIRIYSPLGSLSDNRELRQHWHHIADKAESFFEAYQARQWQEAKDMLQDIPIDFFNQLYQQRIDEFIKHPPPADWDGVFNLTSK